MKTEMVIVEIDMERWEKVVYCGIGFLAGLFVGIILVVFR